MNGKQDSHACMTADCNHPDHLFDTAHAHMYEIAPTLAPAPAAPTPTIEIVRESCLQKAMESGSGAEALSWIQAAKLCEPEQVPLLRGAIYEVLHNSLLAAWRKNFDSLKVSPQEEREVQYGLAVLRAHLSGKMIQIV